MPLAEFNRNNEDAGPLEIYDRLLEDPILDRAFPLQFYSKDVLFSVRARRGWVTPDKAHPEWLTGF